MEYGLLTPSQKAIWDAALTYNMNKGQLFHNIYPLKTQKTNTIYKLTGFISFVSLNNIAISRFAFSMDNLSFY